LSLEEVEQQAEAVAVSSQRVSAGLPLVSEPLCEKGL
jgi:hypothetical protein